jgi:hypothetical protein
MPEGPSPVDPATFSRRRRYPPGPRGGSASIAGGRGRPKEEKTLESRVNSKRIGCVSPRVGWGDSSCGAGVRLCAHPALPDWSNTCTPKRFTRVLDNRQSQGY